MNLVDITDDASNQKMKIPVDDDKSLPLQTLQRYFSGAAGLFYLGEGEEKIAVRFDESMTKLVPPAGGWNGKPFFIFRPQAPSLVGSSVDAPPASAYSGGLGSSAPMANSVEKWKKWMFFARDDARKSCVVCVHPHYFATFRHGPHRQLRVGDPLTVYKAESDAGADESFPATVAHIDEAEDFILLKSKEHVVEKGPSLVTPMESQRFLLVDYGKEHQNLSYLSGVVDDGEPQFLMEQNDPPGLRVRGPFWFATSHLSASDSGGACWGSRGLIGIKLGCIPTTLQNWTILDDAVYKSKIYMASALSLSTALNKELNKEQRKNPKPPQPWKGGRPLLYLEGVGYGEFEAHSD